MKAKYHLFLFVITFQFFGTSFGQVSSKAGDLVEVLRDLKADTIILFELPQHSKTRPLKGIGEVTSLQLSYVFYRKDGASFSKQIVDYCNKDCSELKRAVSRPVRLQDKELFTFTSDNAKEIQLDEIRAYVYKVSDSLTGKEYYQPVVSYHTTYEITLFTGPSTTKKSVNLSDIEQVLSPGYPENLNYRYNNETRLGRLLRMMI